MIKLNIKRTKEKIYSYMLIALGGLPIFFIFYYYLYGIKINTNQFEPPLKYHHLIEKINSIGIQTEDLNFLKTNDFSLQSASNLKTGSVIEYSEDFHAFLEKNNFSIKPENYSIYYDYFVVLHEIGHYQLNQEKNFWYQGDKKRQEIFGFLNQPYSIAPNNQISYRIFHEAYADAFAYQTFELAFGKELGSEKEKILSFMEELRKQQDSSVYSTKAFSYFKNNKSTPKTLKEIHVNSLEIASRVLDKKFKPENNNNNKHSYVPLYFSKQSFFYNENISEKEIQTTWKNACIYWWTQSLLGNKPIEIQEHHNPSLKSNEFYEILNLATPKINDNYVRMFQYKWKNSSIIDNQITENCEKSSFAILPENSLIEDETSYIQNKNNLIQNL